MIGLLGGSFDPIHHGHLLVAQAAVDTLGLTQLRFVVARQQPFKRQGHGASADARAAMVEAAIAGEPRFAVERSELGRTGPSYTIDTLQDLASRMPDAVPFVLLVGADAAADLDSWHRSDQISRFAEVVTFRRAGSAPVGGALGFRTIDVPHVEISSTEIRARVRNGRSIRYWVPESVAAYIASHRLYLDGDG